MAMCAELILIFPFLVLTKTTQSLEKKTEHFLVQTIYSLLCFNNSIHLCFYAECFPGRLDRDPQLGVCPCGLNLICNPDGGREVPQGFTGMRA